jgi:hypothetical protein
LPSIHHSSVKLRNRGGIRLFSEQMGRITAILLAAAIAVALPAAAAAAIPAAGKGRALRTPWATVNVCDTLGHPNQIGIRGDMPGLARRTRMWMRFRVQYRTLDGRWRLVSSDQADSGWTFVYAGRRSDHDAGWQFEFKPPATGGAHVLRGAVSFQWRRHGHVVRRDRRFTEPGHPSTEGADPADFSSEICEIA